MVVKTLQEWAIREPGTRQKRLHLHFFHSPSEVLGRTAVFPASARNGPS